MKSKLPAWLVIITGMVIAARTGTNVYRLWRAGDQVVEQKRAVEQARAENDRLRRELARVSDPAVIEKEARDKLGYGLPGETIVIIPKTESEKPYSAKATEGQTAVWKKWWDLYIGL